MRRARPYRGENPGPGKDVLGELDPSPELENPSPELENRLGHKRRSRRAPAASVLPPDSDQVGAGTKRRYGPLADMRSAKDRMNVSNSSVASAIVSMTAKLLMQSEGRWSS